MEGYIEADYTVMCKNDFYTEVSLEEILANEKIVRAIKAEFAKGMRHVDVSSACDKPVVLKTQKEVYTFRVRKDDFADLLELAEEDARKHKRLKKECDGVALVDIRTLGSEEV